MTDQDSEFYAFAERFVRHYCKEIVTGSPEFANDQEPCEQPLNEVLAEFDFHTTAIPDDSSNRIYGMTMQRSSAGVSDSWDFAFRRDGEKWTLLSAMANRSKSDLLDKVYGPSFIPFLNRIIRHTASS